MRRFADACRAVEFILKLEGGRLTLAQPLNKDPRPVDFRSAKCVLHYLRLRN